MAPLSATPTKIFSLRAVARRLKEILVEVEAKQFWLRAQFVPESAGSASAGHLYCSLVDHDENGKVAARMRAVIWRYNRERIERKLRAAGQEQLLSEGQEICALCSVRYHAVYGLSLEISDVDPTFGESQLERNRRDVLQRLQQADLLERNKQLPLPVAPLRIGLVTAPGSAAYADFVKTLVVSGYSFQVYLAKATMQGASTPAQVVAAIARLERQEVDLICLVRGGGSSIDLASFDHEDIGIAVAQCGKPVWVGIGHEIDVTVPDFVAHTSHKTPTAVATALVQTVQDLDTRLDLDQGRLRDICDRRLMLANNKLHTCESGMRQGLRKHLELFQTRFRGQGDRLTAVIKQRFTQERSVLAGARVRLAERIGRLLDRQAQRLQQARDSVKRAATTYVATAAKDVDRYANRARQIVRLVDHHWAVLDEKQRYLDAVRPERMLARGYSITRDVAGNLIRAASDVSTGDTIYTQLAQGMLASTVVPTPQSEGNDQGPDQSDDLRAEGGSPGRDLGAAGSLGNSHGRTGERRPRSQPAHQVDAGDAEIGPSGDHKDIH